MEKKKKRWTVIHQHSDGAVFCRGVFTKYKTALGDVWDDALDMQASYDEEGDFFEIGKPYTLECEAGESVMVRYKTADQTGEPRKDHYYILDVEGDDE